MNGQPIGSPYVTTAGKMSLDNSIAESIVQSLTIFDPSRAGAQFRVYNRGPENIGLCLVIPSGASIQNFSQPIFVQRPSGQKYYVADIRPFVAITNAAKNDYIVRAHTNYDISVNKAAMQILWHEGGSRAFLKMGVFPAWAFANWIMSGLSRVRKLDISTQMSILILSVYYWYCLHLEDKNVKLDWVERTRIVGNVRLITQLELNVINRTLEDLPPIFELSGFINAIKERTGAPSLASISENDFFMLFGRSISGFDPNLTSAIALEHPPTFCATLYQTVTNRGAQHSSLGELIKSKVNSQQCKAFTTAYLGSYQVLQKTIKKEDGSAGGDDL